MANPLKVSPRFTSDEKVSERRRRVVKTRASAGDQHDLYVHGTLALMCRPPQTPNYKLHTYLVRLYRFQRHYRSLFYYLDEREESTRAAADV